jgi:CRISPR-associated endonuclease Cas1
MRGTKRPRDRANGPGAWHRKAGFRMQDQATAHPDGTVVASGYGLKVYVDRGHLVVHDGIADERCTKRFARVGSGLKRLVIVGGAGYVTLDAMQWLRDVGAAFAQLDSDARLVALSATSMPDLPALRRIQALAHESPAGLEVARALLREKIVGQGSLMPELGGPSEGLIPALKELERASSLEQLLKLEASAALSYWEAWRSVDIRFAGSDRPRVPAHWLTFGQRHSPLTGSPRLAANPANAILNYLYSLLEAEASLACQAVGLDPGIGIFHRDRKARDSLALDLMEACRPSVDAYVLALLQQRRLRKRDFVETRRGVCRLMPVFVKELARTAATWRTHVAPVAESVASALSKSSGGGALPTPLTQSARIGAWDGRRLHPMASRPATPPLPRRCEGCGGELPHGRRRSCDGCRREQALEAGKAARPVAAAVLAELRSGGRDPAHGGDAASRRGMKNAAHQRALRDWKAGANGPDEDPTRFRADVLPLLHAHSPTELSAATGLSEHYCSLIRLGKRVPHARHWDAFRAVTQA